MSLQLHHGTHVACPFHFYLFHVADIILEMDGIHSFRIRQILGGADELSGSCNAFAIQDEAVKDGIAVLRDVSSEVA